MKKVCIFIGDAIKALTGSLVIIGTIEVIYLIASLMIGEYVREDGGVLEEVVYNYITYAIFGYGLAWIIILAKKIEKDEKNDVIQKTKNMVLVFEIVSVITTILIGIHTQDLKTTLLMILSFSILFIIAFLVIHLIDKKIINKINDKIKDQNKEN